MPAQSRLALASRRLPDFRGSVAAATGNLLAIWTEANTKDRPGKFSIVSTHHTFEIAGVRGRSQVPGVPAQRPLTLARVRVADLDGFVDASTGYTCAVWAPCHRGDPAIEMR